MSVLWTDDALSDARDRVLIPEQIGFGKSSKPVDFQHTFDELARQTTMLWDALRVESSHLVGHSMGVLAVRLALLNRLWSGPRGAALVGERECHLYRLNDSELSALHRHIRLRLLEGHAPGCVRHGWRALRFLDRNHSA